MSLPECYFLLFLLQTSLTISNKLFLGWPLKVTSGCSDVLPKSTEGSFSPPTLPSLCILCSLLFSHGANFHTPVKAPGGDKEAPPLPAPLLPKRAWCLQTSSRDGVYGLPGRVHRRGEQGPSQLCNWSVLQRSPAPCVGALGHSLAHGGLA